MTCLLCVATYKQVQTVDFEATCWHSLGDCNRVKFDMRIQPVKSGIQVKLHL
jgi:hypothetical protein